MSVAGSMSSRADSPALHWSPSTTRRVLAPEPPAFTTGLAPRPPKVELASAATATRFAGRAIIVPGHATAPSSPAREILLGRPAAIRSCAAAEHARASGRDRDGWRDASPRAVAGTGAGVVR